ncbi:MAG: histidine phosphatase family protein [bacterium]
MENIQKNTSPVQRRKPAPTTFIFVRHGQTVWNLQGRWQGWLDSPLTGEGAAQAREAAKELRHTKIDLAFCSDTARAIETARIILRGHGLTAAEPVKALRERFYGGWEGLNALEIVEQFPGTHFDVSRDSRDTHRPPGGEAMFEVRHRVVEFLRELVGKRPGKTILLVTHSGVVRVADSISSEKPFRDIWHRTPPNACIFTIRGHADGHFEIVKGFD